MIYDAITEQGENKELADGEDTYGVANANMMHVGVKGVLV